MAKITLTGGNGVTGQTGEEVRVAINDMMTELYAASHTRAHALNSADDHEPMGSDYYLMFLTVGADGNPLLKFITADDIPATIARAADLTAHLGDFENPHQVTAEQLGLTGNITTLLAGLGISIVEGDDTQTINLDPTTLDTVTDLDPSDTILVSVAGTPKQVTLGDFQGLAQSAQLFRGRIYDVNDTSHGVEVLASADGITAVLSGGNTLTFTIPSGVRIISAKVIATGYSTLIVKMGTTDMANTTMANRWIPTCQVWREDTGQPVGAATVSMHLTNFDEFTVNGLIAGQNNHIRLIF